MRAPRGSALGCGYNFVSNPFARLYRNHAAERREVGGEDAKAKKRPLGGVICVTDEQCGKGERPNGISRLIGPALFVLKSLSLLTKRSSSQVTPLLKTKY